MVFLHPLQTLMLSVSPHYPVRKAARPGLIYRSFPARVPTGPELNPNC
jgi:hypothetical protein